MEKSSNKDIPYNKTGMPNIYPIPFSSEEILRIFKQQGNIIISTNNYYNLSKEELIKKAIKFHSEGNISKAKRYYQNCIDKGFNDPTVFSNYGIILKGHGKLKEAEWYQRKSIEIDPNNAGAHINLGNILLDIGKPKEAEISLRKAITLKPNNEIAHYNLGLILKDLGKLIEAQKSIKKSIKLNKCFAMAYNDLALIENDLGNIEDAELSLRKCIKINPNLASAQNNLGEILRNLGKLKEAEESARKAIKIQPNFQKAYLTLGNILKGYGKIKEAEIYILEAIKIDKEYSDAYIILSDIYRINGNIEDAERVLLIAININPECAYPHYNLGQVLRDKGQYESAIISYRKASELISDNDFIIAEIIKLLSLLSDWDSATKYIPLLNKLGLKNSSIDPYKLLHLEDDPKYELELAKKFYKEKYKKITTSIKKIKKKKINVGYFSADFKTHPVMRLLARILELHNRSKFNIYIYSFTEFEDKDTQRAKEAAYCFRSIHKISDIEVVKLARKDQIDIAIDLMGYTQNNRMDIFSYRVAPIQINYLGFPCTTGSKEMDYIIADKHIIPTKYKNFYTEKILYMPNCYLPYDNTRRISDRKYKRSDFKLPNESFVLAAFHRNYKITPKEIKIWSRILKKIPHSILWISELRSPANLNLINCFKNKGIEPKRIIYAKRMPSIDDHLARHSCADIFIDTFNYNGHSTTIDSLWAGLPVVTMMGESFSARVTGSILNSIHLKELISYETSQYEEIIINLSNNPEKIAHIRNKLFNARINGSLFDSEKQTRDIENIYTRLMDNPK